MIKKQLYDIIDALNILKSKKKKFLESVDVSINLLFSPKNKTFVLKGYSVLPYGKSNKLKYAIFSLDSNLFFKSELNFKILNENDLNNINKKNLLFDLIITTPSAMSKFGKLGKILGPKNLMPDVKYGTISNDLNATLDMLNGNYIRYKSDKGNVINSRIGTIDLDNNLLIQNLNILINDIKKQKPKDCKNMTISSLFLTSTMGTSFMIDTKSFLS